MPQKRYNLLRQRFVLLVFACSFWTAHAQFKLTDDSLPATVSISEYAQIASAGQIQHPISAVVSGSANLVFAPIDEEILNIGFTRDHFWVRFEIENQTDRPLRYFLETARPVTDIVNLYTIYENGAIQTQLSGDARPFAQRSYAHRKPLFEINMQPRQKLQFYLQLKSDGEVINMPLLVHSPQGIFKVTLLEQIVFGIFYGILMIAAIIYLFFFFAIKIRSFLYYSCYVVFIGLMQFALDGYFYQYIAPGAGWFSHHAVILFACLSTFFLGKYAQEFLQIKLYSTRINNLYNLLYIAIVPVSLLALFGPDIFAMAYPIANVLGLFVLVLIIASVITLYIRKGKVDVFFTTGVLCLILGFVIFILNNFSVLPNSFFTENSSKFGTGLEVIFLSLSMANYIRNINRERDEFNHLALARAQEMNDLKSYFLSNISHELRTPLNAILNMADLVTKETADQNIKNNCQIIKYSSHSLLSSVNDILDFSKIEKGELKLEQTEFEPVRVLEHLKNNAANRAYDQGLEFRFSKSDSIPDFLMGDVTRLVQIVNNVLANAIKFTPAGFVSFDIDARPKPDNRCCLILTIADSGIGIEKHKIQGIFDSFSQNTIDNKRKFGGLGLGLYIVRTLVEMQQGVIKTESVVGKGTTFKISIEYQISPRQREAPVADAVFDLKGKSILVVEDNAINQMVIKMITKKWHNTQVEYANNGQEGLDALREKHFDLILMDLQMPVMDGYEATIAIRNGLAGEQNQNIPIIALTADVMESTKLRTTAIGMNHYLSKPIKSEVLFKAIQDLF